jgi:hypothetical protein
VPSDPWPDDVGAEPPFGSLEFTVSEELNALLDLVIGLRTHARGPERSAGGLSACLC